MRVRSAKLRAGEEFLSTIVVKPMLVRLETCDDRVTRSGVMFRGMLIWRTIAAADVPAFGASAKMQPPSAQSRAFDTACSAWLDRRVDAIPLGLHRLLSDVCSLSVAPHGGRAKSGAIRQPQSQRVWWDCGAGSKFGSAKSVCRAATTRRGGLRGPSLRDSCRRSVRGHHRCFHVTRRLAVGNARVALPNFYDVAIGIANIAASLTVLGLGLREEFGSSTSP
jgi:hypothetical protein